MRLHHVLALTAAATSLAGCLNLTRQQATCSLASTWTVADEFRYGDAAEASAVHVDGRGIVYVAGTGLQNERETWIVRASSDGGTKWAYSDASNATITDARPRAMVETSAGLFVAGEFGRAGDRHWLVRRGTRDGWTNDDAAPGSGGIGTLLPASGLTALGRDGSRVLAAGYGAVAGTSWILRSRDVSSGLWAGLGVPSSGTATIVEGGRPLGVTATLGSWIVVGGDRIRTNDGALRGRWAVRRSIDQGVRWTDVDNVLGGLRTEARAVATGDNGTVYVAGTVEDASGKSHWVVRSSTNGGLTWSLLDDVTAETGFAQPNTIAVDGEGIVWVGGILSGDDGERWTIRRGKGTAWTTVESFLATGHSSAAVRGIAFGRDGAVYAAGRTTLNGQGTRWLVRKLPCLDSSAP